MIDTFLILGVVLVAVPFEIYVSIKLGTYAFFKGRQIFKDQQIRRENGHG